MTDRTAFGPFELDVMSAAFAAALDGLAAESATLPDLDPHSLRRRLAAGIVAAAREGITSPEDLASEAMRALQSPAGSHPAMPARAGGMFGQAAEPPRQPSR